MQGVTYQKEPEQIHQTYSILEYTNALINIG